MVNAALLVGLALWIWCDPAFMQRWSSGSPYPGTQSPYWLPMSPVRWTILRAGIIAAGVSGSLVLAGLAVGAPRYRGLRAWLLLVTLTAGWLALAISWQDLQWSSQAARMRARLIEFEELAAPLRRDWPGDDGVLPVLGPFSAYSNGESRILMLLTSPEELAERGWQVAAIERSPAGGLRFELEGVERGAWLEWHPAGEGPTSFVGGLGTPRGLTRTKALGNGWFVSRYDSPHRD